MFKDTVKVKIAAGKGGNGKVAFGPHKVAMGGQGGNGGDVYVQGDNNQFDLGHITHDHKFGAQNGEPGNVNNLTGANGKDIIIKLPLTTVFLNQDNQVFCEVNNTTPFKLLQGGIGGMGNFYYSKHNHNGYEMFKPGKPGEEFIGTLRLELQSDALFIGLPNAGKSSLISALTNANAKIGAYAFTTTSPQLGRMDSYTLMDLPGLIEDSYLGKGLGSGFIKHTKRSKYILHTVSIASEDPMGDYKKIRQELKNLSLDLFNKQEVIVLTKTDENPNFDYSQFKKLGNPLLTVNVMDNAVIAKFKLELTKILAQ